MMPESSASSERERAQRNALALADNWREGWLDIVRHITVVPDEEAKLKLLQQLQFPNKPTVVAFVNAHAMNLAAQSEAFRNGILAADIVLLDGVGMAVLLRSMGLNPGINMNGTDLIPEIISLYRNGSVALYGTTSKYLESATGKLLQTGVLAKKPIAIDGFQSIGAYAEASQATKPELIVLGMGMPKQEFVAQALRACTDRPQIIICGGAIIDFLGGKVKRAPAIWRATKFEWLYRLFLEPKRLFRRYVLGNPIFLFRVLVLRFFVRKSS